MAQVGGYANGFGQPTGNGISPLLVMLGVKAAVATVIHLKKKNGGPPPFYGGWYTTIDYTNVIVATTAAPTTAVPTTIATTITTTLATTTPGMFVQKQRSLSISKTNKNHPKSFSISAG